MTVVEERVGALAAEFTGALLRPGDAGYDEARRIHNGLIDKRPAVIARCRSAADVARAIGSHARSGSRSPYAAAATTWPAARARRAVS